MVESEIKHGRTSARLAEAALSPKLASPAATGRNRIIPLNPAGWQVLRVNPAEQLRA